MRLLLADDHPLFLDGLRNLLVARGMDVVGTARDGLQALEQARALRPEIVLMDIHMPGVGGLAALHLIKAEFPEMKVVMLTMSAQDDELFNAIKGGASGYLLKSQDTNEFFQLLDDVAAGEVALSRGLAGRILSEFKRHAIEPTGVEGKTPEAALSPRALQVLTLVSQGLTYKEVGARLFLAERTIKYHMAEIVTRLHLENRTQVIEYARRTGLTSR